MQAQHGGKLLTDNHNPFFMELVKSLTYINVLKEIKDKRKNLFIQELAEAFDDVKQHEAGKKKLKTAKQI